MPARIAFYAPMKPPDHEIASGDREIGRLMMTALKRAGFTVETASRFISYQNRPDGERFRTLKDEGEADAKRIIDDIRAGRRLAPDLWFTYHPYCKAPDWIGPEVARALAIPYMTAEACRTHQGSERNWQDGRKAVQEAVRLADTNFCLKPSDEAYLRSVLPDMGSVVRLTPFLDVEAASKEARRVDPATFFPDEAPIILAVGMMRPGAKILSYRLLAESLSGLADAEWNLVVIGDGPERANVEAMFGFAEEAPKTSKDTPLRTPLWPAGHLPHKGGDQPSRQLRPTAKTAGYGTPQAAGSISPLVGEMSGRTEGGNVGRGFSSLSLGGRVRFTGALPRAEVLGWMKAADLLAWPGIGEAIGMAYLEAAACRLPVAACDVANVATVVTDGESGLLADGDNVAAYRAVLERLLRDHELRIRLGPDGHRKIVRDHDIGQAAETLKTTMEPLIRRQRPGSAR